MKNRLKDNRFIKNISKLGFIIIGCLVLASFSPSLDGRAVVVEPGVFPEGLFAKTVGYLPGDIISVTNIAGDETVDLLVIGALDPSEGVAIMLSPEAAQAMGANKFQIIRKVLLPEAKPSLIIGAAISIVTILSYSAMAATLGGTGLGQIAIIYGHQRSNPDITWICVFLTVIIVQIIQVIGTTIAHKTDKRIRNQ